MIIDLNFQTPPEVCKYMTDMLPENTVKVLEPTPGIGNLVTALKANPALDITAAGDYFLLDKATKYDAVVMNPPFSSKSGYMENAPDGLEFRGMKLGYYILSECMEMTDNVIALMPWFTITDSDVRTRTFIKYGLKSITHLPRKTFEYSRIQTVILELQRGFKGDTTYKYLNY